MCLIFTTYIRPHFHQNYEKGVAQEKGLWNVWMSKRSIKRCMKVMDTLERSIENP
ncbi:hypothetical protein NBO_38g0015 [Nosema bombycis CQ1]|uniref:Uncharacterized protein n=1 Tax=Nosema bombycis (strain CQ1 / CVCC 102059) TaxID=578461 RepID=R0M7Y1_NOSB1|nr:hypothetical protein NBO_38g0015 [Nosema bombycis CQ1]|eukprot:EOB14104.1 hypothetical protein NBO_38g0015 [Nosema bombycis CQ1]